jgi:putative membrane protein
MDIRQRVLAGAAASILSASVVSAQAARHLRRADSEFITAAAQGGLAEVEMGRVALQHGSNDAVKRFGQRMIEDHSKTTEELKGIASQKGIAVPSAVNIKQKAAMDRLSHLNGTAFDRAYMRDMIRDHREHAAWFHKEANHGVDPDLKGFAGRTLPTLQEDLRMARDTFGQVKK